MRHRAMRRRIKDLEKVIRPRDREQEQTAAEAIFHRSLEAWDQLANTMHPDHIEVLRSELERHGFVSIWGHVTVGEYGNKLSRVASSMAFLATQGKLPGPLALPEAVAQVYLEDPAAHPLHVCQVCDYQVPYRTPTHRGDGHGGTVQVQEPRKYFDSCPLCGGEVRVHWNRKVAV
jgi:hypothetical protein